MKVEPVSRTSLSDAVFRELRARILGGQLAPDASLPAERELCAAFGVNRNALREALKRLEQLGLVQIRQGGATRVVDFREEGGLELLPAFLVGPDVNLRRRAVRGLFELRSVIGPDVARRAAERRTREDADALDTLVARMAKPSERHPSQLQRLSMTLWERLARASDNLAYQCTYNSMRKAWGPVQDAAAVAIMDEIGDQARYQKLAKAVREQQPERAGKVARELLDAGFQGLTRFVGGLG
jgi:GntR family transcriptional repressor for pyruvate dehydrogenase complex